MLRFRKSTFKGQKVKVDPLLGRDTEDGRMKNSQFVSYLQASGFRKRQLDKHQKNKQRKRIIAVACIWAAIFGFVWVVIESAQAFDLF